MSDLIPNYHPQLTMVWYDDFWQIRPSFELVPDVHDLEIRDQGSQIVVRYKTSFLLGEGERIFHNSLDRVMIKHGDDVLYER